MKIENWKNWLEGIGIIAIVASLLFVGLQMRQAQQFALAEVYEAELSISVEIDNSIKEDVTIWNKGRSSAELSDDDALIFAILVNQVNNSSFYSYMQRREIAGEERAQSAIRDFSSFLYHNPGAKRIWLEREERLLKNRTLLDPKGDHLSLWKDEVMNKLAILESKAIPIQNTNVVYW